MNQRRTIEGSDIPYYKFEHSKFRAQYPSAQRRRLHYLLDLVLDERGVPATIEAVREWLEMAIDNERFQRHFVSGSITGPNTAERILSALEGYSANPIRNGGSEKAIYDRSAVTPKLT